MKKNKKLLTLAVSGIFAVSLALPVYAAENNVNLSSLSIEQLQALVEQLTAQIKALTAQVNSQNQLIAKLRLNLNQGKGSSNSEVRFLQQLLATDPTLYPEGLTTGFFGELTARAISRFQARYGLQVTGVLDAPTKELLNKILDSEDAIRDIPPGLLRAPGLEGRIIVKTENHGGQIVYKIEVKHDDGDSEDENDDDEDQNDDQDESDDEDQNDDEDENIEIQVRIDDDDAKVKVEEGSTENIFTLDETDEDEIIAKLAVRLGMDEDEIADIIEFDHVDNNSNSWDSDDTDEEDDD